MIDPDRVLTSDEYNKLEKYLLRFHHDEMIIDCEGKYMFFKLANLITRDKRGRFIKREDYSRDYLYCGVSYRGRIYSIQLNKEWDIADKDLPTYR